MAGHSHWASIKHKKAAVDKKRAKLFSKLSRAIIVAARSGGGDPAMNLALRYAIDKAKQNSVPNDNIERAIKRGTGELGGDEYTHAVYEGYGPGGVAVLCEILTDKRTRTASELRKIFEVHGGNLGAAGCVAWMFSRKGVIAVRADAVEEDRLMEIALEAGAEDMRREGDLYEITCDPSAFQAVREALEASNIPIENAELTNVPASTIDLDAETGRRMLALMNALDEHEDVQSVSANFNIPDEVMAEVAAQG